VCVCVCVCVWHKVIERAMIAAELRTSAGKERQAMALLMAKSRSDACKALKLLRTKQARELANLGADNEQSSAGRCAVPLSLAPSPMAAHAALTADSLRHGAASCTLRLSLSHTASVW
jgi:hypothetical protein